MRPETTTLNDPDGIEITVDRWEPATPPVAVVHLLHGWAEHAGRYARFAEAATAAGLLLIVDDHRGHGRTGLAAGGLGDLGPRGGDGVLDAVHAVSREAARQHPDLPFLLVGHSWGSFLAQQAMRRWGNELDGVVLTGTTLRRADLPLPNDLNAAFAPARTTYDWLSRDEAEVQRYIDDPWCGFERMAAGGGTARPALPSAEEASPPADLPVLILNGAEDPIGGEAGGLALAAQLRAEGVEDVRCTAYAGGRHELLNETNRDEVTADLLAWLVERSAAPTRTRP